MHSLKKYFLLLLVIALFYSMNKNWNSFPALGKFVDPYHGCWQNASDETEHHVTYNMKELKEPVEVRFDQRMVPHIFAKNIQDAIFIQGYLHAKFRLWQMDMTTRLAAGRLSEIVGESTLKIDREMRRKGMVYGAENSTKAMESDSNSYYILNAYRDGINAWIHALRYTNFPLEYKLMSFEPEEWTNLKTGLMLKFMADKLSGHTEDFEMTLAKKLFNSDFDLLYPERLNEEFPVTQGDGEIQAFQTDSINLKNDIQVPLLKSISGQQEVYENGIGSNN